MDAVVSPARGGGAAREAACDAGAVHGTRWRSASIVLATALVVALTALGVLWASQRGGYPDDSAEVGFTRDMYVHHQQAVVMGLLVRERGSDPEVASLARDVVTGQAEQQGVMLGWLHAQDVPVTSGATPMAWAETAGTTSGHDMGAMGAEEDMSAADGGDPLQAMGMATTDQLSELGTLSGTDADLLFVQLMIRHHEGAVSMAEAFERVSDEPQLTWLADGIITTQERELTILEGLQTRLSAEAAA